MSSKHKRDRVFLIEIDSTKIITQAMDECPWYFYKASRRLRKDKKTALEAISRDPYTIMFVDETLRNSDNDIKNAVINAEKYLIKYVDEYGELTQKYKDEIPTMGLQTLVLRNQLIQDNNIVAKSRESGNISSYYDNERY